MQDVLVFKYQKKFKRKKEDNNLAKEEEKIRIVFIPKNYSGSFNIAGSTLSIRSCIEAVLIGGTLGLFGFFITRSFPTEIKAGAISLGVIGGGILGMYGHNGDPFSTFLTSVYKFNKNKRACFYNPRPKKEAKPLVLKQASLDDEIFGRKQAQELKEKFFSSKTTFTAVEMPDNLYFEDDIGIVDAPEGYVGAKKSKEKIVKPKKKGSVKNGKKKAKKKASR